MKFKSIKSIFILQELELTAQQKEAVKKFEAECVQETGLSNELLADFKKGNFGENEALDKFFLCFFKKSGIIDANGKINVEAAVSKLPPGADKDQAVAALNECKNATGKDAAATVGKILRCYHDKTKQHVQLQF